MNPDGAASAQLDDADKAILAEPRAIWQPHQSAARAPREGNTTAAQSIIDIADAAAREWLRRAADNLRPIAG